MYFVQHWNWISVGTQFNHFWLFYCIVWHHHYSDWVHFSCSIQDPQCLIINHPYFYPKPQTVTNIISVYINFPFLGILCGGIYNLLPLICNFIWQTKYFWGFFLSRHEHFILYWYLILFHMTDLPHFAASKTSALLLDLGYYDHSCVNLCVDVSLLMSKFLARELLSDMVANCI